MAEMLFEILTRAGHYPPNYYSDLLTFFSSLEVENSNLDTVTFIPIAPKQPHESSLFAVGILPPAVNVSGRLLDRTNSVAVYDPEATKEIVPNFGHEAIVTDLGARSAEGNDLKRLLQDDQFWINYVSMCRRLGVKPEELAKVIQGESGWSPNAVKGVSKGFIQLQKQYALKAGMPLDVWDRFESLSPSEQLVWVEKVLKGKGVAGKSAGELYSKNAGGYNLPGFGYGYMSAERFAICTAEQKAAIEASVKKAGYSVGRMFQEYRPNALADANNDGILGQDDLNKRADKPVNQSVLAAIATAEAAVTGGETAESFNLAEAVSGDWANRGSQASQESSRQQAALEGSPLVSSELGKAFSKAQLDQIKETQNVINRMATCPPLAMRINPASFAVKGEKIANDGNWGRSGPIIEYWGDNQDKVSGSGRVGGFYAIDTINASGPGLTRWSRNFSASWQNFQALYLLYRSNGALFLKDNFSLVGSVYLFYDSTIYIGSFDSFSITEDAANPFTVEYSFEFTVRAAFLLNL